MKTLFVGGALVVSLVVSTSLPADAHASVTAPSQSKTTTAQLAALGVNATTSTATTDRSVTSDVYHVPTAYVDKMKAKCRHTFKRPKKVRICEAAQGARAVASKFAVTQFRSRYFRNAYERNHRLATRCWRHHHWCARYSVGTAPCGPPWAPPLWHIHYMCLKWRAQQWYNRWLNLVFFRNHTVPLTATDVLRLASQEIGPSARPNIVRSFHSSFFGGPYEAFTLNRSATELVHSQVDLTDGVQTLATSICTTLGFVPQLRGLAIGCAAYVSAAITGVRNDINQAFSSGECVEFRLYFLYPLPQLPPLGPLAAIRQAFDPTTVVGCPSSRTMQRRTQS